MAKIWPFRSNNDDNYKVYNYVNINDDGNNKLRNFANQTRDFLKNYGVYCVIITLLVCLFVLAVYTDIHERDDPHYDPFTFQVDFLEVNSMTFSRPNNSITSNQPDDSHLSLNLTVNTKGATLFKTVVSIEYDHHLVSNTTIAPFHQDALSVKTIPVLMGRVDTRLSDEVIDSISTKLASEGVLDFTVIVSGENWKVCYRGYQCSCDMKMICKGVTVTLSSTNNTWNGSTKDGPFLCEYSSKGCYF